MALNAIPRSVGAVDQAAPDPAAVPPAVVRSPPIAAGPAADLQAVVPTMPAAPGLVGWALLGVGPEYVLYCPRGAQKGAWCQSKNIDVKMFIFT